MMQTSAHANMRRMLTWKDTVARGYVTPRKSARGPSRAMVCRQHANALEKPWPGCSAVSFASECERRDKLNDGRYLTGWPHLQRYWEQGGLLHA